MRTRFSCVCTDFAHFLLHLKLIFLTVVSVPSLLKVFAALWSHSEKNYIPHAVAPLIMMIIIRTDCEKPY